MISCSAALILLMVVLRLPWQGVLVQRFLEPPETVWLIVGH